MSNDPISLEQGIQILSRAFSSMRSSTPNPAGWEDKLGNGASSGETVRIPRPRHGLGGEDDPSAETPVDPGFPMPHVPGDPPGWSPRPYAYGDMASTKYGPHNPVLSDQDAATLHLVWSIMGIDGSTVGKGQVTHNVPVRDKNGKIVGWTLPIPGENSGYFNGQVIAGRSVNGAPVPSGRPNPLGKHVSFFEGAVGEQDTFGRSGLPPAEAAPWGYDDQGRPLMGPHDPGINRGNGVSIYAPNMEYGPFENKYAPTKAESDAQSHDKRMM